MLRQERDLLGFFLADLIYTDVGNEDFTAGDIDLSFLMLPSAIAPLSVYVIQCVSASSVNTAC